MIVLANQRFCASMGSLPSKQHEAFSLLARRFNRIDSSEGRTLRKKVLTPCVTLDGIHETRRHFTEGFFVMDVCEKATAAVSEITRFKILNANHEDSAIRRMLATCESPIEQILLTELISRFRANAIPTLDPISRKQLNQFTAYGRIPAPEIETFQILIWPQYSLDLRAGYGEPEVHYRLDLAIHLETGGTPWRDRTVHRRYAIEVDGHEFHEKTKEQAARDRSRERQITADGWIVLRFTGSEVFNNPEACAESIEELITQHAYEASEGGRF